MNPSHTDPNPEPIAIIGMGCRYPGAQDVEAFWQLLVEGRDAIEEVPPERWDIDEYFDPDPNKPGKVYSRWGGFLHNIDQFDAYFFGISPREADPLDPRQRLLLEVSWEALEDAGIAPDSLAGSKTGVFIAVINNEYGGNIFDYPELVDAYTATGNAESIPANRLSYVMDLRGPSLTLDTACSGSLVAMHFACQSLRRGESELALVGGVNLILNVDSALFFSRAGALSPDGRCKTFDASANGIVRSDGVGMIVLKPLSKAIADNDRVYAVIRGSAVNQDGRTNGIMAPNPESQQALLRDAYASANIPVNDVQYIEAHGTGTKLGDPIEVQSIGSVLCAERTPDELCVLGSVKTNLGHMESTAGVAGVMKVALAMQHRILPPSLHYQKPNPLIPFDTLPLKVQSELGPWPQPEKRLIAGVSGFGFGGTNAHVILEEAPPEAQRPAEHAIPQAKPVLLPLTARSESALKATAERYHAWLETIEDSQLANVAYTAARRRSHMDQRLVVVGADVATLRDSLAAYLNDEARAGLVSGLARENTGPLAWVFSGQGSHWIGMGKVLAEQEPVFGAVLAKCDAELKALGGWSLLEELNRPEEESRLNETQYTQPAIFSVQVALAALWRSWGIKPDVIVGQSLGEVAAAHVAGALSLEDAIKVVFHRSRLMQRTAGQGLTAAVGLPLEEAQLAIAAFDDVLAVAGSNSPTASVLSGDPDSLERVLKALEKRGTFCRLLRGVDVAFHSPQMDPLVPELIESLASIEAKAPEIALYSTVLAAKIEDASLGAEYWARNLREPFLFTQVAQELIAQGVTTFLEVSPHPVIGASIMEGLGHANATGTVLPSLRRQEDEAATLLASLGKLWVTGNAPDWSTLYPKGELVRMPAYPWQRERYWYDQLGNGMYGKVKAKTGSRAERKGKGGGHPLVGSMLRSGLSGGQIFWETDMSAESPRYLADHRVQGALVLPGVTYMEMALATAAQTFETNNLQLQEVDFKSVLVLPEGGERSVQCVWTPGNPGSASFQIISAPAGVNVPPEAWQLHATGKISYAPEPPEATEQRDIAAIQADCPEEIPGADHYAAMSERGLEYGPAFQAIKQIWRREGEALGQLKVLGDLEYEVRHYFAHPTLLDGCLQVVAATTPQAQDASNETFIPVAVKELKVHQPIGGEVWCRAIAKPQDDPNGPTREADLEIIAPDGTLVAELNGLRLQRISQSADARLDNWLFEIQWHAQARPEAAAQDAAAQQSNWFVFADNAGIASDLIAKLEARGDHCVLVRSGQTLSVSADGREAALPLADKQALANLFEDASKVTRRPCRGVILLNHSDSGLNDAAIEDIANDGLALLLHLSQTLGGLRQSTPPSLWVVTCGAQAVAPGDNASGAAQALLWGTARVIHNEHPELSCRIIDLDPAAETPAEDLLAELSAPAAENQIVLRGEQRFVARLNNFSPTPMYERRVQAKPGQPYTLSIVRPGLFNTLTLLANERQAPGPGQVEVKVHTVGMNFKDIMYAMGFIRNTEGDPSPLGLEFAGTVVAVGEGVDQFTIGDEVIGGGGHCFSRYLTRPVWNMQRRPANLSPEEGAGIITAFGTTHYSINHLARLRKGERILIHSATGGVGLAAIQLAQLVGAEIFATAGTPEKRDYLRELGIKHVMDSRSLDFADEIMEITNGEGVDVVLNSLVGEGITRSMEVLRPFGRFIEIGKRDILQNKPVGLGLLEKNISLFVFELASLMEARGPHVWAAMGELNPLFISGRLKPLPTTAFDLDELYDAFHYLRQGKHIGKVVVRLPEDDHPLEIAPSAPEVRSDATYLLTGGTGGLGLTVSEWLVSKGARSLVLLSRSGKASGGAETLERLKDAGATVTIMKGDVGSLADLERVIVTINETMPPLRGVIHAAGVLDDGLLANQTPERFAPVLAPKVWGAWNLHQATKDLPLDMLIFFSSAASVLGNPGQGNYAAGNAFMDALAFARRAEGLPALSINWGPWAEVGMAAAAQLGDKHAQGGMASIKPREGVLILERLLAVDPTQVAAMAVDMSQMQGLRSAAMVPPLLALFAGGGEDGDGANQGNFGQDVLMKAPTSERQGLLEGHLIQLVAKVLRIDQSRLGAQQPLNSLGIDSIMAVELQNYIKGSLGLSPSIADLLKGVSVADLTAQFLPEFQDEDAAVADILADVEDLSDEELAALLADELLAEPEAQD